jgi:hypothetical protein
MGCFFKVEDKGTVFCSFKCQLASKRNGRSVEQKGKRGNEQEDGKKLIAKTFVMYLQFRFQEQRLIKKTIQNKTLRLRRDAQESLVSIAVTPTRTMTWLCAQRSCYL